MNDAQLDALVAAAGEGVALDGLHAGRDGDGYRFRIDAGDRRGVREVDRAGLSESRFREVARDNPWFVSNWHYWTREVGGRGDGAAGAEGVGGGTAGDGDRDGDGDRGGDGGANRPGGESHRYAFLRWIERADELSVPERYEALAEDLTRSWGQLRITATVGEDGRRRYGLRHAADADADLAALEVHPDPLDARELVKFDERGRYRPLKTAPTLPTGWAFADLGGADLVRAVDLIYPATVANWHLERRGRLDVSHWHETVGRQTGIYGVIETWDRQEGHEHVDWVTEACCVDSQCLKRREWEYDEDTELDTEGGDGRFPCREPCSLVIAAARQWTKLEGEQSRTYEFELTPSEKEQIEEIVDAVADGRAEEVREADVYDGANRYRARFLRAKRFDGAGNLSGTPTDRE